MATILIAGGNEDDRRSLSGAIQSYLDCRIVSASDGNSCVELAETQPPDALVLDVDIPPGGGFEVCRSIRYSDRAREIPVIMLIPGEQTTRVKASAIGAGADDYLCKPVDILDLATRLKLVLRLRRLAKNGLKDDAAGLGKISPELAHKLRSPLNSVLGMAELVQKPFYGELTEKQREFIQIISRSGNRLLDLINALTDD